MFKDVAGIGQTPDEFHLFGVNDGLISFRFVVRFKSSCHLILSGG